MVNRIVAVKVSDTTAASY